MVLGRYSGKIGIFILVILGGMFLFGNAMAVVITESPEHIAEGDLVTLSIHGLPDNSTFSIQIQGTFTAEPGSSFTFQTSHFIMPFSLKDGEIHATVDNTRQAFLEVTKGDQTASVGKNSITTGHFSYSVNRTIYAGTYDSLTLKGTAQDSSQPVTTLLQLKGVKSGPDDSDIVFNVDGIESGTLQVTIVVDGNQELSQNIVIGTPAESTPGTSPESSATSPEKTPLDPLVVLLCVGAACLLIDKTGGVF